MHHQLPNRSTEILMVFIYFTVNVNKITFAETRKHELEMERQMFQNVKRMAHDTMAAKTQVLNLLHYS